MSTNLTENGVLVLPQIIDLRAVEALKSEFLQARGQALTVDASGVERLSGLGLQVLLSAIRTWKADGQVLTFINVADAMTDQWSSFGAPLNDLVAQDAAA